MSTSNVGVYHTEQGFVSSTSEKAAGQALKNELQKKISHRALKSIPKPIDDLRAPPPLPQKKIKVKRLPLKPLSFKKVFFASSSRFADPKSPATPTAHQKSDAYIEKLCAESKMALKKHVD